MPCSPVPIPGPFLPVWFYSFLEIHKHFYSLSKPDDAPGGGETRRLSVTTCHTYPSYEHCAPPPRPTADLDAKEPPALRQWLLNADVLHAHGVRYAGSSHLSRSFHRCDRPVALRYGIEVHRYRNTPTSTVSTYVHLDTPFSAPCIAILHPSERQSSKKHCQPLLFKQ